MFYDSLNQRLISLAIVVLLVLYLVNVFYQSNKKREYQKDERWQMIKVKSNGFVQKYYELVLILCALAYLLIITFEFHFSVDSKTLFFIIIYIMLLKGPIEYFSTRYFDQRL